jgi:hypothetical protein
MASRAWGWVAHLYRHEEGDADAYSQRDNDSGKLCEGLGFGIEDFEDVGVRFTAWRPV